MGVERFPLDLAKREYSYVERANSAIEGLLAQLVLSAKEAPRILDIGCGCGANARAIKERSPRAHVVGIEPSERAAELARKSCDEVFHGTFDDWAPRGADAPPFDALILSDVLEHVADPVPFLQRITRLPSVAPALWIISVPNYAVWYNRVRTLLGQQEYTWSGLWDRTHLRFYSRRSIRRLLEYCGLAIVREACTPSLVQSAAPVLRKFFERDVDQGDHLALADSSAFKAYRDIVEPVESAVCRLWPELLAFQVVHAARLAGGAVNEA